VDYTVYGLQRSGTNFLETLIKLSFKNAGIKTVYEHNVVWKHASDIQHDRDTLKAKVKYHNGQFNHYQGEGEFVVETYDYWIARLRETNAIFITKHPFTWIDSVIRKEVDMRRHKLFDDSKDPLMFAQIYREHAMFWKEQRRHQSIPHIKYEDLLANRQRELLKISDFFNDPCVPFVKEMNTVKMSSKFTSVDKAKYMAVKTNLSKEVQKNVVEIVGKEIMENYGYTYTL
jgi:hypothetical protein